VHRQQTQVAGNATGFPLSWRVEGTLFGLATTTKMGLHLHFPFLLVVVASYIYNIHIYNITDHSIQFGGQERGH